MNIKEQRAAALAKAQGIMSAANGRDLTDDETTELDGLVKSIEGFDDQIARAERGTGIKARLGQLVEPESDQRENDLTEMAKSIGEHFADTLYKDVLEHRGTKGYSRVSDYDPAARAGQKAATDTQSVGAVFQTPVLTQFDRTIIQAPRPALVLADLLGSGTLSGNAISYFVEQGPVEGAFTTVAEGAAKPQLHIPDPTIMNDVLKKIAGFIKFTDEMMEDLGFVVSEINTRLVYELRKFEESQLINGNGTGTNVLGLLNRSGIQTMARTAGEPLADVFFRAMTAVQTGAGLNADGVAVHPLDYQKLRLSRDSNGQYFGGGFFNGQYGQGGIQEQPPIWGLRTVVTPSIAQGTALVGAFGQAATVYRKGGLRIESTNSHGTDFTDNKITVRAEGRVALAVRRPAGIVKVNLADVAV